MKKSPVSCTVQDTGDSIKPFWWGNHTELPVGEKQASSGASSTVSG